MQERQVRAVYTDTTITVYQAYSAEIAAPALRAGRFVPFKRERMTWIKPSFLWMMYRCGWAAEPGAGAVGSGAVGARGCVAPPLAAGRAGRRGGRTLRLLLNFLICLIRVR
jgi:hypothetical protein